MHSRDGLGIHPDVACTVRFRPEVMMWIDDRQMRLEGGLDDSGVSVHGRSGAGQIETELGHASSIDDPR